MTGADDYLQHLPDWQQANLRLFRELIHTAYPQVTEEIKWGVPVFTIGMETVFAMSAFKAHTKFNFLSNGAQLTDASGVFNNGLESKKSRGIDLTQGQTVSTLALSDLIAQAIAKI